MNLESPVPLEDNIMVLVDHVPETVKYLTNGTKDSSTPETLSLLTEPDDSLVSTTNGNSPKCAKPTSQGKIQRWCTKKLYADMIADGLEWLASSTTGKEIPKNVMMVYESPCSANPSSGTSFYNDVLFQFHDYPLGSPEGKTVLGPLRYGSMTGDALPTYLQSPPPPGLCDHWRQAIPNFVAPNFVHEIPLDATVCAYLPLEKYVDRHLIDPHLHYELAGKDSIPAMTKHTTKMLHDLSVARPCIVKATHCMGSRGIFVIHDDNDKEECLQSIDETGNPNYIVTEFIDIERNLAAHFFIHPSGDLTWFGASENLLDKDAVWSPDSTIACKREQDELQEILAPYVQDVAQYCVKKGYWGACGIDVLLERNGRGYVVDVNPRVTGTCPALMVFQKLSAVCPSRFAVGTFRRSKKYAFPGSVQDLLDQVNEFNALHDDMRIVIFSLFEQSPRRTFLSLAVYGASQVRCVKVLNRFAARVA